MNQLKDAPAAVVIGTPVASISLPNPSSSFQTVNKACTYLVKAEKGKGSEFSAVRAEKYFRKYPQQTFGDKVNIYTKGAGNYISRKETVSRWSDKIYGLQ